MRSTTSRLAMAAALATGLAGGMIAPALADVSVTVTVDKTKDIVVSETITIDKLVTIEATVPVTLDGAAEAQALANMRNGNNDVTYNDTNDAAGQANKDFQASIANSILSNTGVIGVNQDAGYNAKQGNLVAVGLVDSGNAFANAQAEADQINSGHHILQGPPNPVDPQFDYPFTDLSLLPRTVTYETRIGNSINNLVPIGVVGVNQNAGNNNNQLNEVAVAAGVPTGTGVGENGVTGAISEAALGQENTGRVCETRGCNITESGTYKTAHILASLNDNVGGIIGVNQASGNNANQANQVSVAVSTSIGP